MPKARVGDRELFYEVAGDGFPICLISGFAADRKGWLEYQYPFFSQFYKTVIHDKIGTGESDKPDIPYTIEIMAADVIGILDHLGIEKAHMVGNSMGGVITQMLGIKYPNRVQSLVLSNTFVGGAGSPMVARSGEIWTARAEKEGVRSTPFEELHISYTPEYIYRRRDKVERAGRGGAPPWVVKNYLHASHTSDTRADLAKIKAPTLILVGKDDYRMRLTSDWLNRGIRDSEMAIIPGAHASYVEYPEIWNTKVMEFTLRHTPKEYTDKINVKFWPSSYKTYTYDEYIHSRL